MMLRVVEIQDRDEQIDYYMRNCTKRELAGFLAERDRIDRTRKQRTGLSGGISPAVRQTSPKTINRIILDRGVNSVEIHMDTPEFYRSGLDKATEHHECEIMFLGRKFTGVEVEFDADYPHQYVTLSMDDWEREDDD